MTRFAPALALVLILAASARTQDQVVNPEYASWAKFKAGTFVAVQDVTDTPQRNITIVRERTLVSVDKDKLVIQTATWTSLNGNRTYTVPYRTDVPRLIPKAEDPTRALPVGKSEGNVGEGTETLKFGTVEVKTKWYLNKDKVGRDNVESKFWVSDEFPGTVVKSVTTGPGSRFSKDVLEFKPK